VNELTDQQLLRDYIEHRSEAAFAELTRRHLDLVHSAALRMVRDEHLARDVTQATFLALAQNAPSLMHRPVLSGWLHRTSRNLAAKIVRSDTRRRAREQEAVAMNNLHSDSDASWEEIAPHLDAALGKLNDPDRDTLLMRYFERKSASEIARTFGISDEAAQKRASRALERLRNALLARGVKTGAGMLAALLPANAVQTPPIGLATTLASAGALTGTVAAMNLATNAGMSWITAKTVGAAIAAAITAGSGMYLVQWTEVDRLREESLELGVRNEVITRDLEAALEASAAQADEIERLRRNQSELARLRAEVGRLRREMELRMSQANQQPAQFAPPQQRNIVAHPPGAYLTLEELAFAGYATPEAALQSHYWATLEGDYDQFLQGMTPEGRVRHDAGDEALMKERLPVVRKLFKGVQIIARKVVKEDQLVQLKFRHEFDGQPVEVRVQPMLKIGEEWKLFGDPRTAEADQSWDENGQIERYIP
jgi:RNA polymerase sigma factor (sigma-70 family)